jgi:hypothetical protein
MCQSCSRRQRVFVSARERFVLDTIERLIAPVLEGQDKLHIATALPRIRARKVLTTNERLVLGTCLLLYGEWLDGRGLVDRDAEKLYRKMMGHDRRTMQPGPEFGLL